MALNKGKIQSEFIGIIRGITLELSELYPTDPEMNLYKQRINLAMSTTPEIVLNEVGLQLLEYRKQILDEDDQFFLSESFSQGGSEFASIRTKLRETWKGMHPTKQRRYKSLVKTLLYLYSDYKLAK